jgi:hypothetical protein
MLKTGGFFGEIFTGMVSTPLFEMDQKFYKVKRVKAHRENKKRNHFHDNKGRFYSKETE